MNEEITYYINDIEGIYTGDRQPGDRPATVEEIAEHLRDKRTYAEKRAAAYPDFRNYLDAQVKLSSEDSALQEEGRKQLSAYFSDCLTVKMRIPKE